MALGFPTGFLLALACAAAFAWAVALMHERGVRPVRNLVEFFKSQPKVGRVVVGALFASLWVFAGAKPGGGTDAPPASAGVRPDGLALRGGSAAQDADEWSGFAPIASTNTTRTLAADDFRRGFVMTRIGTDEAHDFSAPAGATVCADWEAFGAAEDWIHLSFTNWSFRVGTNDMSRLRVFSSGQIDLRVEQPCTSLQTRAGSGGVPAAPRLWPLRATLGIVPRANWRTIAGGGDAADEVLAPSRFWHFVTPSNTLRLTWQNALLGRRADTPVSFQAELWPDGRFAYRHDLSRCGGAVAGVLVGASFAGGAWTTNALPANATSIAFHPLSAEDAWDADPDGDGIPTVDELFVHGTDPRSADTDMDGLTDGEELFAHGTDPLNPRSLGGGLCDGIAVKTGGADPLSCPEGSTNTVLEHVFYSGTTNGPFTPPQASEGVAVLRVGATGFGTGDLVVDGLPVPLVAPGRSRAGGAASPTLLVPLAKGTTHVLLLRGDGGVGAALDSDDFAFGALPSRAAPGRVNFPNTAATAPCIHDFNARAKAVSLPVGEGAEGLVCTWSAGSGAAVSNVPPRAAVVSGGFPAGGSGAVSYALAHPEYLFGRTEYGQEVRFCPRTKPPDPPGPADPGPSWSDGGLHDEGSDHGSPCPCGAWCVCGAFCICDADGAASGDDVPGDVCPVHSVPFPTCAPLHDEERSEAARTHPPLAGALYLRDPPVRERIRLEVVEGARNCCPCPDHWTDYVAVAYRSPRLRLVGGDGLDFSAAETSCDAFLYGVRPSSAAGDAVLALSRNGEVYMEFERTVLGVSIGDVGEGGRLATANALAPSFGMPMTVCTNVCDAPGLRLVTDVMLPGGSVRVELADATARFAVWWRDRASGEWRVLLDSETAPVKDLSTSAWRSLVRRGTDGAARGVPVRVTSPSPGSVRLVLRYWNVVDGAFAQDEAVQRVTSVLPPLRLDVNRDGAIDGGDAAAWLGGRAFRYWTNEDVAKGDWDGADGDRTPNADDLLVNGTWDLVNLFPVALDLSPFTAAWGGRVRCVVRPEHGNAGLFHFCLADVPWGRAGSIQTTDVSTLAGRALSSAPLVSLPADGVELSAADLARFSEGSGLMVCEAKSGGESLRVEMRHGDEVLYSYSVPMDLRPVREMYSWRNCRRFSDDRSGRPSATHRMQDGNFAKALVFLHGANVSSADAERWGDAVFKRTWLAGMNADFYNVDWRSDMGSAANYHENASNAFAVAGRIASEIMDIPGERVVMAHSLGNMVVSSMIQDHGLEVSKYLMCNSAVPAEAYDASPSLRVPQLVHPDWEEYPTNSWASTWHVLFRDDPGDDRKFLGWPGRFAAVAEVAVNFYSAGDNSGDEVLQLYPRNDIGRTTGITDGWGRYAWHKQEIFKGRGGVGGTDWSGWNVDENVFGWNRIQPSQAWRMADGDFKTNTVFYRHPESMNSPSIPLLVRGAHLANGIPALTPAAGVADLSDVLGDENSCNVDISGNALAFPNGWPARSAYPSRWLHSDLKNVSFFYNFKFYEKAIEKGGLK